MKFKLWSKGFCCWVSCEYNKDKATTISPHGYLMWRVNWFHLLNWTFEMCIDNILLPLSIYDIRFNYVHLVVLISLLSISHEHILALKMHCNYVKSDSNIYISKLIINITHFLSSLTTYPFWDGRSNHKWMTNKTKQNQVK